MRYCFRFSAIVFLASVFGIFTRAGAAESLAGVNLASQELGAKVSVSSQWGAAQSGNAEAGFANDGDFESSWAPGTGFGVEGDYLLLDMGRARSFNWVRYEVRPGEWLFPRYKVEAADKPNGPWRKLTEKNWTPGDGSVNIHLEQTLAARYIKLTALKVADSGRWCNIQEVMVFQVPADSGRDVVISSGASVANFPPGNVIDGKEDTCWKEDHPGWLTVRLAKPTQADGLAITYPSGVNSVPVTMNLLLHHPGEGEDTWHYVNTIIQQGSGRQVICFPGQTVDAYRLEFSPRLGDSVVAIAETELLRRAAVVNADMKIQLSVPRPANSRNLTTGYGPMLAQADKPLSMLLTCEAPESAGDIKAELAMTFYDDHTATVAKMNQPIHLAAGRKSVFEIALPKLEKYGMVNACLEITDGNNVLSSVYARYPYVPAGVVGTRPDERLGIIGAPLATWASNGKNFRQSFYWAELESAPGKPFSWDIAHPVFNLYPTRAIQGMIEAQNIDSTIICLLSGEPAYTRKGVNFDPQYTRRFSEFCRTVAQKVSGLASYYEVLNEVENASSESYITYFNAAYDSIRAVDPAAKFTLTGMAGPNAAWLDNTLSLVGAGKISAINYHLYNWGTDENCLKLVRDMESVAVKHGKLKHFITEMGYFSSNEPLKSAHIVRATALAMAGGADMILDYAAIDSSWSSMSADGTAASPYLAWMIFGYKVSGLTQVTQIAQPKPAYAVRFTDGKRSVYCLWRDELLASQFASVSPVSLSFSLPAGDITVSDLYGNNKIIKHSGGVFKIDVSPTPLYLEYTGQ